MSYSPIDPERFSDNVALIGKIASGLAGKNKVAASAIVFLEDGTVQFYDRDDLTIAGVSPPTDPDIQVQIKFASPGCRVWKDSAGNWQEVCW